MARPMTRSTVSRAPTLNQLLAERVQAQPDGVAYALVDDDGERARLTYAALDQRARAVAAVLRRQAAPGDRALLLCPFGLDYLAAFFGCQYAGLVAVPLFEPAQKRAFARI